MTLNGILAILNLGTGEIIAIVLVILVSRYMYPSISTYLSNTSENNCSAYETKTREQSTNGNALPI